MEFSTLIIIKKMKIKMKANKIKMEQTLKIMRKNN